MPNYFAPAFRVKVNDRELQADISKNIEEISVVSQPDTMGTFNIVLSNEYPKMRWTHTEDADLFMAGNSVTIEMGYVDEMAEVIDGEITKLMPTFPDSGVPTLTVEGYTRLHRLHSDKKTRTFPKMSDKQIIEKIANEAGLDPQVEETGEQFEYIIQANETDLEFIRKRARRIHYEVIVRGKTLIFRKPQEDASSSYTFVWGHTQAAFSSGPNTLPLKSFSPDLNALNQIHQVKVRGYDPVKKEKIEGTAGLGDEDAKKMGISTGAQITQSRFNLAKKYVRVDSPIASQAEADQRAKAIYNQCAMELVSGSANTIGVPGLRSGIIVEILGLGARFSGLYYVKEATHSLGSGGYSTNFTVQRNALDNDSGLN